MLYAKLKETSDLCGVMRQEPYFSTAELDELVALAASALDTTNWIRAQRDASEEKLAAPRVETEGDAARDGVSLIAAERKRQVEAEGWSEAHDASEHQKGELADAAECYLHYRHRVGHRAPNGWPWAAQWWKVSDDPVRNLVKAGALIAAEIDRLQRASRPPVDPKEGAS